MPVGETGVLSMSGSTTAPTGFTWTLLDKTVYQYDGSGRLQTITDRNGNAVTLGYGGGQLADVKDPNGRILYTFAYSGTRLASVTDLAGRTVNFTYTSGGQAAQAVGPKGTTAYGYSNFGVPGIANLGNGALVDDASFTQDAGGRYVVAPSFNDPTISLLTSVTSPNGFVTTFTLGAPQHVVDYAALNIQQHSNPLVHNAVGPASSFTLPLTMGTSRPTANKGYYTPLVPTGPDSFVIDKRAFAEWYYPQKFWTLSEAGPLGTFSMEYTIDELLETGSTVVTDPRGFKTTHKWKTANGQTASTDIIDPDGAGTTVAYDAQGNPAQATDRAGRTTTTVFDAKGNPVKVTDPAGQNSYYSYENGHNRISSLTDVAGHSTSFVHDTNGNLTQILDAGGNAIKIGYDSRGLPINVIDPLGHVTTIGRNGEEQAVSITDPLDHGSSIGYDILGRITSFSEATATTALSYSDGNELAQIRDALGGVTNYNYGPGLLNQGKILASFQNAASHSTQFSHDSKSRLTAVTNTLGQSRSFEWDEANHLTKTTKPDGTALLFTYDALGRLVTKGIPGDPLSQIYDAAGNVVGAESGESRVQISYDALNRPIQEVHANKAANLTTSIGYAYDANGNLISLSLASNPQSYQWQYSYDSLNRLTSIRTPESRSISFEYDATGRRTRALNANGIETLYAYDSVGQLISLTHRRIIDQVVVASATYAYDGVGNRTTSADSEGTHSYAYDALHRLVSATHPSTSIIATSNEAFAYDAVGNRTADRNRTSYVYDSANRLMSDSQFSYTYDANGNQISRTTKSDGTQVKFTYNAEDRLVHVYMPDGTASYKYDGFGRRMEKTATSPSGATISTTRYVYNNKNIVAILDGNNSLIATFTNGLGLDEPLIMQRSNGLEFSMLQDGLGNIVAHVDAQGNVAERIEYESYGRPFFMDVRGTPIVTGQSLTGSPFAFTGREFDLETGLYFFRERQTYDPTVGRFGQEDPLYRVMGEGEAAYLNSVSQYLYAGGNPTNLTDPRGLAPSQPNEGDGSVKNSDDYYSRLCASGDTYACRAKQIARVCFDTSSTNNCVRNCLVALDPPCIDNTRPVCGSDNSLKCRKANHWLCYIGCHKFWPFRPTEMACYTRFPDWFEFFLPPL